MGRMELLLKQSLLTTRYHYSKKYMQVSTVEDLTPPYISELNGTLGGMLAASVCDDVVSSLNTLHCFKG
jgi:hypothetical protein